MALSSGKIGASALGLSSLNCVNSARRWNMKLITTWFWQILSNVQINGDNPVVKRVQRGFNNSIWSWEWVSLFYTFRSIYWYRLNFCDISGLKSWIICPTCKIQNFRIYICSQLLTFLVGKLENICNLQSSAHIFKTPNLLHLWPTRRTLGLQS